MLFYLSQTIWFWDKKIQKKKKMHYKLEIWALKKIKIINIKKLPESMKLEIGKLF